MKPETKQAKKNLTKREYRLWYSVRRKKYMREYLADYYEQVILPPGQKRKRARA